LQLLFSSRTSDSVVLMFFIVCKVGVKSSFSRLHSQLRSFGSLGDPFPLLVLSSSCSAFLKSAAGSFFFRRGWAGTSPSAEITFSQYLNRTLLVPCELERTPRMSRRCPFPFFLWLGLVSVYCYLFLWSNCHLCWFPFYTFFLRPPISFLPWDYDYPVLIVLALSSPFLFYPLVALYLFPIVSDFSCFFFT